MRSTGLFAPKILIIPGSLRAGSQNARLAAVAGKEFVRADVEVTRISLGDFPLPIYDADLQANSGVPASAVNLKQMIAAHDGILIVTPEYNASLPPLLKNAIDWISCVQSPHEARGQVFHDRAFAIASASAGRFGGARCLAQLRLILTACGSMVIPSQLALSFAGDAYDDMERLKRSADADALKRMVRQLIAVAGNMR